MNFSDVRDDESLHALMTEPSDALVRSMRKLKGDVLCLGASGKMGGELLELILAADRKAGVRRRVSAASTFSAAGSRERMEAKGIRTYQGDLSDRAFLKRLPSAKNVFYMAGFKFGSSSDPVKAYHYNVIMPYLVAERYRESDLVCFATTNFYAPVDVRTGGADESAPVQPEGIYGWSAFGRENAFRVVSEKFGTRMSFFRLGYAQHLHYGVLIDLAKQVLTQKKLSFPSNYVCLVSQRDANEVALRSLSRVSSIPWVVNCCGPICRLDVVARAMARQMGRKVEVSASRSRIARVQSDRRAVSAFGAYRDQPGDMIRAAVDWVMRGGRDWNKPTGFLRDPRASY